MEKKETLEEWKAGFEGLDFEQRANRVKDKILESEQLDQKSRLYFTDMFNYVMNLYKEGKPLDTNLLRIHMTDVKSYSALTLQDFSRSLLLLTLCGFEFGFNQTT